MFFDYIYPYGVNWVGYDAMESNMCLMQIFVEFWRQSQRFNGQLVAIIQSGQWRGFIGGNPPHLLLPTSNSPSCSSEHKQPNQCTRRQPSKWRITYVYLEFWEPSLPNFEEAVGSFICISREAVDLTRSWSNFCCSLALLNFELTFVDNFM